MNSFIFFVEGVHDANCMAKMLFKIGFREINHVDLLPEMWKARVPRNYPFTDDRLDRFIPMPSYFIKHDLCVVVASSNGAGNIINDIDLYLSNMNKCELKQINGVCAIFDADENTAQDCFDKKFKKFVKDRVIKKKDFIKGYCKIKGEIVGLHYYFFPDNNSPGTLENFLLEGAKIVYTDLLQQADEYVGKIDDKYKYNWTRSSENKVRVGCIANVFQPGGANQTSIRYDDWISNDTLAYSPIIKKFYDFIVEVLELG